MTDIAIKSTQTFTVSHLDEADFKTGGLRSYSAYRDLGIAAATNGLATAHVIRMIAPFNEEMSQRHCHNVEFQLVYVLKGWFKTEFEGYGVQVMKEGSCWTQPPQQPEGVPQGEGRQSLQHGIRASPGGGPRAGGRNRSGVLRGG